MKMKFRYIMLIMALAVAGCAAYFSVWGLSQLFAGAGLAVIIMASVLEIAKLVVTTALHTYWDKLAKSLRVYLSISVIVLMLITSAGIYGFLSNAYQKTANKLEIHEGALSVLNGKKNVFQKGIDNNQKIIDTKNKRLDQLSGLRTTQETRIDGSKSNRDRNSVRGDIASANSEIQKLSTEIDVLNSKNGILSDSIGKYNVKALEMKSGSDVAGEVGPLKYIAELTGIPMAKVVNYMILLLIFVFDPLAISLVLATNKAFELAGESTPLEPKKDSTKEVLEDILEELKHEHEEVLPNDVVNEENKDVKDNLVDGAVTEVPNDEEPIVMESQIVEMPTNNPIMSSGKIALEDIKEIKEGQRGYSVNVPQPKGNNTIERIGSNKLIKDGNNSRFFFKRE
jgi:hypothetical protein